ncbi:hypothetical protein ACGF07_03440 [Kitasatospora sp. NPDC048194]|uniref:hypothetical protein n=1 Tax=Kitasatospora sp. NPDC048194 TaxID=3364045 RepID=UPI0037197D19
MTDWIKCGVIAWLSADGYGEDESVLVYFRGTSLASMAEGLVALHRPPLAHGNDPAPGDWGVIVHSLHNPSRDDYGGIDYRKLCPQGVELVVFVPNPCIGKSHGPKAYHYRDGRTSSCIDYEGPEYVGEYWPNELAPVIAAAGLNYTSSDFEQQLTQLLCDHLGLPALDPGSLTIDHDLVSAHL